MSDVSTGIIRMPIEIALGDHLANMQYHAAANDVLDQLCAVEKERDELLSALSVISNTIHDFGNADAAYMAKVARGAISNCGDNSRGDA